MFLYLLSILIGLFTYYYYFHFYKKAPNAPPGPLPLPIFGNLNTIGTCPHEAFTMWSKRYGSIVEFMFGPDRSICLNGLDIIKEASLDPKLGGRHYRECKSFLAGEDNGIFLSAGETWKEQRRFALRNLRDFGFGKSSMEELILDNVREVLEWLRKQNGKPIEIQARFALAVINSLWTIVTGERFQHDDPKLHKILDEMSETQRIVLEYNALRSYIVFFLPTLAKLFPTWSGWGSLVASKEKRVAMYSRIIAEHEASLQEDAPRDFVDVYLTEVRHMTNPRSSFHAKNGGLDSLKSVMADFFVAGTDTTSVTLSWFNLYLVHNPEVQKKIHEELDRIVGRIRTIGLADRKTLPYTDAVIHETMRLSSISPFSVHAAMEDTTFRGFDIRKGTLIWSNLYGTHHDPDIWGQNVNEFVPERFLSPDGTTLVTPEAFIPFSYGKRVCLGERLARDTVFLFASNIAQNFEVSAVDGESKPPLKFSRGHVTLPPVSTRVVLKERPLVDRN